MFIYYLKLAAGIVLFGGPKVASMGQLHFKRGSVLAPRFLGLRWVSESAGQCQMAIESSLSNLKLTFFLDKVPNASAVGVPWERHMKYAI